MNADSSAGGDVGIAPPTVCLLKATTTPGRLWESVLKVTILMESVVVFYCFVFLKYIYFTDQRKGERERKKHQ